MLEPGDRSSSRGTNVTWRSPGFPKVDTISTPAPTTPDPIPGVGDESASPDFPAAAGTIGRLTLVNVAVTVLGFGSGVLQARGLGPQGRGELAAIVVPLYFVTLLGDLGLGLFVRREVGRNKARGEIVGTVGAMLVVLGVVLALALLPLVHLVAQGRPAVHKWVSIGLLLLPVNLAGGLLLNVAFGLERWRLWFQARLLLSVGWVAALAALYATGHLTVGAAAGTYIALTVASSIPLLAVLRRSGRLKVRPALSRTAVPFGLRAWLASLTNLANTRLDQLLMAGLVSSRELGLYAVAVTLGSFPSNLSGAVGLWILPRVVRDGEQLVPKAVRLSLVAVVVTGAAVAAVAWPFVHLVIGQRFADAVPMTWILLVAEVPLAGTVTLGQAFIGAGRPGWAAAAEGLAVVVTVSGLVLLLRPLGGIGAALVSLVAYSVSFSYLLGRARGQFGASLRDLVVPTRDDLRWGAVELRRLANRGRRQDPDPAAGQAEANG